MTTLPGDPAAPVDISIDIFVQRTREHHPRSGDIINAASATIDITIAANETELEFSLPIQGCQDVLVLRDAAQVFIAGWVHELRHALTSGAAAVTSTEIRADLDSSNATGVVHIATAHYRHDVNVAVAATNPDAAEAAVLALLDARLAEAGRAVAAAATSVAADLQTRLGKRSAPDWLVRSFEALGLKVTA
jgi:hypothetical protein